MNIKRILDWSLLIYGLLIIALILLNRIHPELFRGLDSDLIFAGMIFGFTILTIIKNRLRGLDNRMFIQQILLALILILAVVAITRYRM